MANGRGDEGRGGSGDRPGGTGPAGTAEPAGPPGLPRGAELLWGGPPRTTRGPRPALSLDRIVGQAVAIADAEGLAALSMQRLAKRLKAGTMSLYRYVPGKDELVALMLDLVVGDPPALPGDDWRGALRTWAEGNRATFHRHPWALTVVISKRVMGPNETAWAEAALRSLAGTGLPLPVALEVMLAVNGYVRGAVQLEVDPAGGRAGDAAQIPLISPELLRRFAGADRYPTLMAAMGGPYEPESGPDGRPDDPAAGWSDDTPAALFEFGLERLLDGIAVFVEGHR